ncbi:unnamed protein product, partial [marine sediment metagenome]
RKGMAAAGKATAGIGLEKTGRAARAVGAEATRIRKTYQAGRTLGLSRPRAAGESIRRYWQRRAKPAMRPAAVRRTVVAAGRGILSATGDIDISQTPDYSPSFINKKIVREFDIYKALTCHPG